ncbi:MAG: hypothetical protein IJW89_01270 [Clostridia bacterium]|nr:hypothetical protein [Clostridia bacterium]
MRGKRWLALVLTVLLALPLSLLTGCDAINAEDVKADPMKFVDSGMALTLGLTSSEDEFETLKCSVSGNVDDTEFDATLAMDALMERCALELLFGENGISVYYDENDVAIKSDLLKDLFGTDTVGFDVNTTEEALMESPTFLALLEILGMSAEEFESNLSAPTASSGLESVLEDVENNFEALLESDGVITVTEETIHIDDEQIDTIAVDVEFDSEILKKLSQNGMELGIEYLKMVGLDDAVIQQIADSAETVAVNTETKYYLAVKTGALVKTTWNQEQELKVNGKTTTVTIDLAWTFGATPEVVLLPAFDCEVTFNEMAFSLDGKSSIDNGKLVMNGSGKIVTGEKEENGTYTLTVESDGDYMLQLFDDENEKVTSIISGTMHEDENGMELTAKIVVEESEIADLSFAFTVDEAVPTVPEYKDLLALTKDELLSILQNIGMAE